MMALFAGDAGGGAGGVDSYSAMRPFPSNGHQLRPDSHWSPVIGAYYDPSDTEDTGAGRICQLHSDVVSSWDVLVYPSLTVYSD